MTRDYAGRRPERPANVLTSTPSRQRPPAWPLGAPSAEEQALWADLWRRPAAQLWRSTFTAPVVVARYVRVLVANPGSATLAQMEAALGLTPASLARLRVTFEQPRPTEQLTPAQRAVLEIAS